jgi:hypothetical protein
MQKIETIENSIKFVSSGFFINDGAAVDTTTEINGRTVQSYEKFEHKLNGGKLIVQKFKLPDNIDDDIEVTMRISKKVQSA